MSSMYNMIFGENESAGLLVTLLSEEAPLLVPRYRDCYLEDGKIAVYTRTGGGNRPFYESEQECRDNYPEYWEGDDPAEWPEGPWNEDLYNHPLYFEDRDDDFDTTYATFYFHYPEKHKEMLTEMAEGTVTPTSAEKWMKVLETLKGDK